MFLERSLNYNNCSVTSFSGCKYKTLFYFCNGFLIFFYFFLKSLFSVLNMSAVQLEVK